MRSLVLGGSTFVGRRLVNQLVERGDEVGVLNRGRTPSALPPQVRRFVADRTDAESMRTALAGTEWDAVHDVSGFVMVAGGSSIGELLEIFDGRTGAYVFVSSIMAYEPTPLMPWTEDQPVSGDPPTSYGGFKAYAETEIRRRFEATGFPGSVARPAAIYGPDNNIHDMETAMFLRLRRGLPVLLPHGGLVTVSYGHVDDLCAQLIAMADTPASVAGEVFNATGQSITSAGYVQLLADIVGAEADVRMVPDSALAALRRTSTGRCGAICSTTGTTASSRPTRQRRRGLPAERGFMHRP